MYYYQLKTDGLWHEITSDEYKLLVKSEFIVTERKVKIKSAKHLK